VLSGGYYFILTRDDAQRLFAANGDDAILQMVDEFARSKIRRDDKLFHHCGDAWNPIHRCLTEGTLDREAGEFPLNHCVLGGRRLSKGSAFEAVLIRPDIVPHVAEALHRVKRVEFREAYWRLSPDEYGRQPTEKEFDFVWTSLLQIRQLFEDAAENREAVLFAVQRERN
jgi:hypothetical protein